MAKPCNEDDCNNPIWSTKKCKFHQNKRTDDKWIRSQQKRLDKKPAKLPRNLTPKPYSGINDFGVKSESELYKEIWYSREHKSFLSGKPLNIEEGTSFWFNIFAHALAKGKAKYPKFKLYSKNIILLTPQEHNLLDFCSSDDREDYAKRNGCDWKKVYDIQEELKSEYKEKYG